MREWTRQYLKEWDLGIISTASQKVEGGIPTYGLWPLDRDHGESGTPLGLQENVPCRRGSLIAVLASVVTRSNGA